MEKNICIVLVFLFFISNVIAQKEFHVQLKFDSSIIAQNVQCKYYNGKATIAIPDTIKGNIFSFSDTFYSPAASIHIGYTPVGSSDTYTNDFFIGKEPATIDLFFKEDTSDNRILNYSAATNATPIYDTNQNEIFRQLIHFRKKEVSNLMSFLKDNGAAMSGSDSLSNMFFVLSKSIIQKEMEFLKKYPQDYFSFWFFRDQVVVPSINGSHIDTTFLKQQLIYLQKTFPNKFINSAEGRELASEIAKYIQPLQVNDVAPAFTLKDILGNNISLESFKGKYLLLDFWATWCGLCMNEMLLLKKIRDKFSVDDLGILGVSADNNIEVLKGVIKSKGLNWQHVCDRQKTLINNFSVTEYPTIFLIDKQGKIIKKNVSLQEINNFLDSHLKQIYNLDNPYEPK